MILQFASGLELDQAVNLEYDKQMLCIGLPLTVDVDECSAIFSNAENTETIDFLDPYTSETTEVFEGYVHCIGVEEAEDYIKVTVSKNEEGVVADELVR